MLFYSPSPLFPHTVKIAQICMCKNDFPPPSCLIGHNYHTCSLSAFDFKLYIFLAVMLWKLISLDPAHRVRLQPCFATVQRKKKMSWS